MILLLPINVLAQEETPLTSPSFTFVISDAPSEVSVDEPFSVSFSITNEKPNTDFHIKGYCIDHTTYLQTQNGDLWLNYSGAKSSWVDHPSYTLDSNGSLDSVVVLKPKIGLNISENVECKLKLKSDNLDEESTQFLEVIIIKPIPTPFPSPSNPPTQPPTITPTSTSTPTNTPKPTSTIKPTSTPKPTSTTKPSSTPYPTSTPKPTLTPTLSISPSPTDTITDTPTPEPSPEILGEYDDISETISFITPTASPSAKTNHVDIFGIIPYFLITAGGGLLLTPTLITKFKK